MELKIDDGMIKNVVSEAILNAMSQQQREMLIKSALQHLLTKGTNSYDRTSPIEQAFHDAVRQVARKVAEEMMSNDPQVTEKMKTLVTEALELLMTKNREKTVASLADAIAAGMAYRSRD